jgi:transaldolase
MKFFLQSDDAAAVRDAAELGLVDGVMTSRAGAARAGMDYLSHVLSICQAVEGPVSAEVSSMDRRTMVREAESLLELGANVIVRVPAVKPGLKACRELSERGRRVQVTPCYQPMQAVAAAKAGAAVAGVALFLESSLETAGRGAVRPPALMIRREEDELEEIEGRGSASLVVLEKVRRMFSRYGYATEILVLGAKAPEQLLEAAMAGAEAAVVTPALLEQVLGNLETEGVKRVATAWRNTA